MAESTLSAKSASPARAESLIKRRREHKGRNAFVNCRLDCPAAFAGIGYAPGEFGQLGILKQRCGGEIKEPRCNDAPAPPDFRDICQIEIILIMLGIAQRRGFRIDHRGFLSDVGGVEDIKPFRIRGHHAVFDAVMHHLDEMPGAIGPAMQVALFGAAVDLFAARRARDIAAPGRQRREDRIETLHDIGLAANHHAIAALEPPHPAAGADVDKMKVPGFQFLRPANIVNVIRVAAIDQDVAAIEMRQQVGDHIVDHAGRHHQPDELEA